jgi:pyruvate kinase
MPFPPNKTKIVATIGPASDSPEVLRQLILAGMNVVRLNFSHGDFSGHAGSIAKVRAAAAAAGRRIAIMADLPGPKMRIGKFSEEPVHSPRRSFTLTTKTSPARGSVYRHRGCASVRPGAGSFSATATSRWRSFRSEPGRRPRPGGGELRSRKGVNLPGIDLGIGAFTEHDRSCLEFALRHGVDAVSQSFVDRSDDITAVRAAAAGLGYQPMIIAKIERSGALRRIDEIMDAADGIMVARGDLGVEIPIEEMAVVQKRLMRLANLKCSVITATQMLESMITNRLPTRAEATDVANAILDGTDAVMLSGESAMGRYPVDAVSMLAKIAAATEFTAGLRPAPRRGGRPARTFGRGADRRQRGRHHPADHARHGHRTHSHGRHGPPHRPIPAAGVDHRRKLSGKDLPGLDVLLRGLLGVCGRPPGPLAGLVPPVAGRAAPGRSLRRADRRPVPQAP